MFPIYSTLTLDYSPLVWGCLARLNSDFVLFDELTVQITPVDAANVKVSIYHGDNIIHGTNEHVNFNELPNQPRYKSTPSYHITPQTVYVVGLAAYPSDLCRIIEAQPHIKKAKYSLWAISHHFAKDLRNYILQILIELIRVDPQSYIQS